MPIGGWITTILCVLGTAYVGYSWWKESRKAKAKRPKSLGRTRQGAEVFAAPGVKVLVADVERALHHYAVILPKKYPSITEDQVRQMINGARMTFDLHPTKTGRGWAGQQQGLWMRVHYEGDIADSEFFHELGHMSDEFLRRVAPDYQHTDALWWAAHEAIDRAFK